MLRPSRREPLIPSSGISTKVSTSAWASLSVNSTQHSLNGVSEELFKGVGQSYMSEVLSSVSEVANEYMEDVVSLTNLISAASFATSTGRTEKRLWDQ